MTKKQEFIDKHFDDDTFDMCDLKYEAFEKDLNELIKDTCIKFKFETHDMNNAIEPFRSYIMEAIEKQFEDWNK